MRRVVTNSLIGLALAAALAAAGCQREPRFDDRYNETARTIEQRAATLDVELNRASSAPDNTTGPQPRP